MRSCPVSRRLALRLLATTLPVSLLNASPALRTVLFGSRAVLPGDINGLKLWLKADSIALNDNDAVTTWPDGSGLGNNAVQATEAAKPTYKTAIVNGKPVVRFDGIDDTLAATVTGVTSAYTVLAVVSLIAAGSFPMFVTWNDAGHELRCENNVRKPELVTSNGGASAVSPDPITLSVFYLLTGRHGGDGTILVNGAVKDTEVILGDVGTTTVRLGSRAGVSLFANCDIAEVLIYDTALSSSNRQAVEAYLASKYAIAV